MTNIRYAALALALLGCEAPTDDPIEVEDRIAAPLTFVMYGNSYSSFNGGIDRPLERFAREAGIATPSIFRQFRGSAFLRTHVAGNNVLATIPAGTIDVMVAQGQSLECTTHPQFGNQQGAINDAVALVGQVLAHSPSLGKVVLYETYAREEGNPVYPSTWADPPAMQAEITQCYEAMAAAIEAQHGVDTELARVGEAFALGGFGDQWADFYGAQSHPSRSATMMVGQAIATAAYSGIRACPVPEPSEYATWPEAESWRRMAGFADRVAAPTTQALPGSLGDFHLSTGTNAIATLCPMESISAQDQLTFSIQTPLSTLAGGAAAVYVEALPAGAPLPTRHPVLPAYFTASAVLLWTSGALTNAPQSVTGTFPAGMNPGDRLLLQAIAVDGTFGNLTFSNAHVLTAQ